MSTVIVPKDATALDVLAEQYRAAFDKMNGGREQWIEGTLELAAVLLEAKRRPDLADTKAFSRWITRHQLEHLHHNEQAALIGIGEMERRKPGSGRKLLEENLGLTIRTIWEKRAKGQQRTLTGSDKGPLRPVSHRSGAQRRIRAQSIPTVMQRDNPPPPPPKRLSDYGLTPEQVDPDFKGTRVEFTAKYGPVNLHTKEQIEQHKREEVLQAWLGALADHAKTAQAMLATPADAIAVQEWISKPAKAEKMRGWCQSIQLVSEALKVLVVIPLLRRPSAALGDPQ